MSLVTTIRFRRSDRDGARRLLYRQGYSQNDHGRGGLSFVLAPPGWPRGATIRTGPHHRGDPRGGGSLFRSRYVWWALEAFSAAGFWSRDEGREYLAGYAYATTRTKSEASEGKDSSLAPRNTARRSARCWFGAVCCRWKV